MADIFISYSREDRGRADQVAQALQAMGLDVFWDSEIPPGQTWADYIEARLSECKAVVVLWSEHSTKSQWVREEARMGRDKGKLIPAMIDNAQSPFGFGEVQAANLADWHGEPDHAEWRRFSEAVRAEAARERPAAPYQPGAQSAPQAAMSGATRQTASSIKPIWWIGGLAAVALVVVVGLVVASSQHGGGNAPIQTVASVPSGGPAPVPPAQATPPAQTPDYQAQIQSQLTALEQRMAQQGFQMVGQPSSGALPQGQSVTLPASLNVGYDYRIAGVCDQDCADLDLALFDQNNTAITQDTSTDDHPVVSVAPRWTGPFTVQVQMYQCSVPPCYYGVALFGRAAQQTEPVKRD